MIWAAGAALAVWLYLLLGRGGFWLTRERDTDASSAPASWPSVVAVVPARDEEEVIARSIGSLVAQDYPGPLRIVLVDDDSSDGTADVARSVSVPRHPGLVPGSSAAQEPPPVSLAEPWTPGHARGDGKGHVEVLTGAPLPAGWTGKLWAVHQGVAVAGTPDYLWLTDADIEHAPDTLTSLVARAESEGRVLVSLMAKLRCDTLAERALIPAFVFFFAMLYPFARVNRPGCMAGAAGGCMLARRDALEAAGGIAAIRGALIDDCAFGALMKRHGPIWLGLTQRSRSIRPYGGFGEIRDMIARSAYAQLGYSPLLLLGTLLGLALVYLAPPVLSIFSHGPAHWAALAAWALMALSFQPMLRFYRRSPLWGPALPLIASVYAGCTLLSALRHWQGRGGMWKGRAQAQA